MKFGNLLYIKDTAFLLHYARSFIQTGLNKGVIAGKWDYDIRNYCDICMYNNPYETF